MSLFVSVFSVPVQNMVAYVMFVIIFVLVYRIQTLISEFYLLKSEF